MTRINTDGERRGLDRMYRINKIYSVHSVDSVENNPWHSCPQLLPRPHRIREAFGQGSVAGGRVIRGFEDQDVLFKRPKIIAFANTRVQTQSRQRASPSDERTPRAACSASSTESSSKFPKPFAENGGFWRRQTFHFRFEILNAHTQNLV